MLKLKSALISVFNKDGLEPIAKKLDKLGVKIYSTGGTELFLKKIGIPVIKVEDVTGYPSILGGRVKTLHPKIFGGILNRNKNNDDIRDLENFDIPNIPETYVHRIGRTGRAGKSGIAFSFCSPDENEYIKTIETLIERPIKVIDEHPYPIAKPKNKKPQPNVLSKNKKGRKSEASKKNKKRWY